MYLLIAFLNLLFNQSFLEWNKTTHDFGVVEPNATLKFSFICYNKTPNTIVEIENIQTSCGCVATQWKRAPLQYNDSMIIEVTYKTSKKNKTEYRTINVLTNKGLQELKIYAKIEE